MTRYGYTGRERDSSTGLLFYRARWYDSQQGRFVSEDPIGFEGGDVNFYAYVNNDPINANDPVGLQGGMPRAGIPPNRSSHKKLKQACDTSDAAVTRAARQVASKIPGASVGIQARQPVINFRGGYTQTIGQLQNAGYYSGILAFNPLDHAGGYEFRTYGSPGFHFKVVYPDVEETHVGGRLGVRISDKPAVATDLHIDCNNPVGSGITGTVNHGIDFAREHTPWWLPYLIPGGVLH